MNTEIYSIILIYIQQDASLHSLFYLETALHVLGGTITHHHHLHHHHYWLDSPWWALAFFRSFAHLSLSRSPIIRSANNCIYSVWYLSHCYCLCVRHSQHTQTSSISSTIVADGNNGVTNTRCCRCSCLCS